MRPAVFVFTALLLLVLSVAHRSLWPTQAQTSTTPAITNCAQRGAAVQGDGCAQTSSLDSTPANSPSHRILAGACGPAHDLHVVTYRPAGHPQTPAVVAWCR